MASAEHDLIARYFKPLARHPGALGLTDDAAMFTPPAGCDLVITKDALVAGVHFFADDPPDAIGQKALRVNLSDLAAKGAAPAGFLLALALPADAGESWIEQFALGMKQDSAAFDCPLLGGDTVRTPGPVTISITAFGTLPSGRMVKRSGAKAGDRVFVTGTIGDAALGLKLRNGLATKLNDKNRTHLLGRYLLPQPRNALAAALREHASAAMDVSDGLAGDLAKLCAVSGVSASVAVPSVPLSEAARAMLEADATLIEAAITGGDDYEIVCTVPAAKVDAFTAAARTAKVPVAGIGTIAAGTAPPVFTDGNGQPMRLSRMSFSHF